jgi:hypothetical protein
MGPSCSSNITKAPSLLDLAALTQLISEEAGVASEDTNNHAIVETIFISKLYSRQLQINHIAGEIRP